MRTQQATTDTMKVISKKVTNILQDWKTIETGKPLTVGNIKILVLNMHTIKNCVRDWILKQNSWQLYTIWYNGINKITFYFFLFGFISVIVMVYTLTCPRMKAFG